LIVNRNRPAYIVMRGIISPECIAMEGSLIIAAAAFAPIPAPASADGWRVDQVDGHKADQLDDRYRPTTPHTPTTPPAYAPR
jgi:hypothetical protein